MQLENETWEIKLGDVMDVLATLPDNSVHCVCTSPPYFGLRDYGTGQWEGGDATCNHVMPRNVGGHNEGDKSTTNKGSLANTWRTCGKCGAVRIDKQIGLEPTPAEFVETMVRVFREVRRVLRPDGTCWVNMGDSYAQDGKWGGASGRLNSRSAAGGYRRQKYTSGLKHKDLMMIPARVAIALQDDGWWLRSDIIWAKRAPMPESVTDRPTSAHEHIFLLTKQARYYYDADAIREASLPVPLAAVNKTEWQPIEKDGMARESFRMDKREYNPLGRNAWNYWLLSPEPYPESHFATFPTEIPRRAILAGTSEHGCCAECGAPYRRVVMDSEAHAAVKLAMLGKTHEDTSMEMEKGKQQGWGRDKARVTKETLTTGWQATCTHNAPVVPCTVLDPFSGAGTTVMVALRLGRHGLGIELNPSYVTMSEHRIVNDAPLFNSLQSESNTA